MRGGANNIGTRLTDNQIKKLKDRYFGGRKDCGEIFIGFSNKAVACYSLGLDPKTILNILRDGKASKKVLEKLDFIFNK